MRALFAAGTAALALAASSCASAPRASVVSSTSPGAAALVGVDGAPFALRPADAKLTVVEFFSAHCPCQKAHDARLRDLWERTHAQGVAFVAVDSEFGSTREGDATEARQRAYPFPLVLDPGGALAEALGAEYATYTVVLDAQGRVVYRGGIDTDKWRVTEGATPFLAEALRDALSGAPPGVAEGKTLGCALRRG